MPAAPLAAIVLAAGEGTRMHSERPKPLHRLCGRPMVLHVLDALAEVEVSRVVVVVGHRAEWVTRTLAAQAPAGMALEFVEQASQRGTGDAAAVGLTGLPPDEHEDSDVIVLPGDTPLIRAPTLAALVRWHRARAAAATVLTAEVEDAAGYGRVVRGRDDGVVAVVEQADASADQQRIREVNTSIYCFRRGLLAPSLRRVDPANAQGEYYLTDVVAVLAGAGHRVEAMTVGDPVEAAGVNDRAQLAAAEAELRARINERWMRRGVTMWDPEHTYIDAGAVLDADVTLMPNVVVRGATSVGRGAEIGPDVTLVDSEVDAGAEIRSSWCTGAAVGAGAVVGPFAVLGPGSTVAAGGRVPPFTVLPGHGGAGPRRRPM